MKKKESGTFDQSLFGLLQLNLAVHQLNRHYEQAFGLSIVQWCLLKHLLDLPGVPANGLAKSIGVHPSTLTQSLRRLTRKQYLFATTDPKDSRKTLLSITRAGKEILDQAEARLKHSLPGLKDFSEEMLCINKYLARQLGQLRADRITQ